MEACSAGSAGGGARSKFRAGSRALLLVPFARLCRPQSRCKRRETCNAMRMLVAVKTTTPEQGTSAACM